MALNKRCSTCRQDRPVDRFSVKSAKRDGLNPQCKDCQAAANRSYYKRNRDLVLAKAMERKYGLQPHALASLRQAQRGLCSICSDPCAVVDHDHSTGEVRGLLCQSCNKGLGFFRDNPDLLMAAVAYLAAESECVA